MSEEEFLDFVENAHRPCRLCWFVLALAVAAVWTAAVVLSVKWGIWTIQ